MCVMGFFLLKVGPPLEKFSGSAPVLYVDYAGSAQCACVSCSQKPVFPTCDPGKQIKFKRNWPRIINWPNPIHDTVKCIACIILPFCIYI